MKRTENLILSCILGMLLNACAFDIVHLQQIPTQLKSASLMKNSLKLEKETEISLDTGYSRTLKQGTKWNYVGISSYGDIYKTNDQILTVEGSNIHEAYIVISSGKLVGFYLPAKQTYSPLDDPVELQMSKIVENRQ